ncbi:hypothetical protein, partial [Brevundimonas sp. SL161]|uniref:hypothetical protein n=1 Tax=Brevundimonas sp. SL161 TaxID=2804613 RepID=UPI003CED0697
MPLDCRYRHTWRRRFTETIHLFSPRQTPISAQLEPDKLNLTTPHAKSLNTDKLEANGASILSALEIEAIQIANFVTLYRGKRSPKGATIWKRNHKVSSALWRDCDVSGVPNPISSGLRMNTDTFLQVRLDRVVQSAALTAGCKSSILIVRHDTDLILAKSCFGKAPEPCDPDQFETLLAAINQTDQGILLVDDLTDPVADLCQFLPRWDSQVARFAAFIAIKDHDGQARGLLVICDPKPKPGLSPAKIYVLLSLAFQIADSLTLHRLQANEE